MHKDAAATASFFETFRPLIGSSERYDVVICPPFLRLEAAVGVTRGTGILIDAQNLHWPEEGAYTSLRPDDPCVGGVCIGEFEKKNARDVIAEQFRGSMGMLTTGQFAKVVIAYEPCCAIGSGDAHRFIRSQARANFGEEASSRVLILC